MGHTRDIHDVLSHARANPLNLIHRSHRAGELPPSKVGIHYE